MHQTLLAEGAKEDIAGRKVQERRHLPCKRVLFETGCCLSEIETAGGQGLISLCRCPGMEKGENNVDHDLYGPPLADKGAVIAGNGEGAAHLLKRPPCDRGKQGGEEPCVYAAGKKSCGSGDATAGLVGRSYSGKAPGRWGPS